MASAWLLYTAMLQTAAQTYCMMVLSRTSSRSFMALMTRSLASASTVSLLLARLQTMAAQHFLMARSGECTCSRQYAMPPPVTTWMLDSSLSDSLSSACMQILCTCVSVTCLRPTMAGTRPALEMVMMLSSSSSMRLQMVQSTSTMSFTSRVSSRTLTSVGTQFSWSATSCRGPSRCDMSRPARAASKPVAGDLMQVLRTWL
mmetsp:Transcript_35579/g.111848  ORF Transcript_35579/g.111848 Transcript_35579/m.111848 type:complete len:202 (-) Transcript_35579:1952-2557(-)